MTTPTSQHPDDAAVDRFAAAMKDKLAAARAKGRGGWERDEPGMQQRLSDMLRQHVEKGDPRDVANFCMFLYQRGQAILPAAKPAQDEAVGEIDWGEDGAFAAFYPDRNLPLGAKLYLHPAERACVPDDLVPRIKVACKALIREKTVYWEDIQTMIDVVRLLESLATPTTLKCIWPDCGHDSNRSESTPGCNGIGCPTRHAQALDGRASIPTEMPAVFGEWFGKNYPGPDTIISDPHWHAPRIWKAARHAMLAAAPQPPAEGEESAR